MNVASISLASPTAPGASESAPIGKHLCANVGPTRRLINCVRQPGAFPCIPGRIRLVLRKLRPTSCEFTGENLRLSVSQFRFSSFRPCCRLWCSKFHNNDSQIHGHRYHSTGRPISSKQQRLGGLRGFRLTSITQ